MTIVPGVGITNVVAIGMTLKEIKSRADDLHLTVDDYMGNKKWFHAEIPSLGVSFGNEYKGKKEPYFGWIDFHVASDNNKGQTSFRGALSNGPSFAKSGGVSRADILAHFGVPRETLSSICSKEMPRFMVEGTPFALVSANVDILYYTAEGIMFDFKDGRLVRVAVCPKQSGRIISAQPNDAPNTHSPSAQGVGGR
jgi:hypothetical protein